MLEPGKNLNDLVPSALASAISLVGGDFGDAARCFSVEYESTERGVIAYGRVNNPDKVPAAEITLTGRGLICEFTEAYHDPSVLLPMVLMGLLSKIYPERRLALISPPQPQADRIWYLFNNGAITSEKVLSQYPPRST